MANSVREALPKLYDKFNGDRISWRVGSTTADKSKGLALAYIDARDVMERLDLIVGPENWQCDYPHANGKTVCRIGIKIDNEWVWKSDGAGDSDVEAEKGAMSDAFKRAAVRWGIGRYLYDLGSPWVLLEPAGKSYRIKPSELDRLAKIAHGAKVTDVFSEEPAKPAELSEEEQKLKVFAGNVKVSINAAMTVEDVDKIMELNKDMLAKLKAIKPETHEYLLNCSTKRRNELVKE